MDGWIDRQISCMHACNTGHATSHARMLGFVSSPAEWWGMSRYFSRELGYGTGADREYASACLGKRNSALFLIPPCLVSIPRVRIMDTGAKKKKKTKQRWTVGDQSTTGRLFLGRPTFEIAIGRKLALP